MLLISLLSAISFLLVIAYAAFGVTDSGTQLAVDTAGGLVFKVSKSTGDIVSLVYNSIECQDSSKFSQISSGLASSNVVATTSGSYIKITVTTDTLIQYCIAKPGDLVVQMATYITTEPSVGELRFIARLKKAALPNGVTAPEVDGGTAIEGSDIFLLDGQTRSKFYSGKRFVEDQVHCVTGTSVGACMVIPGYSYESSSGGSAQQELYFYMSSGHVQYETFRVGLHGPYGLVFTSGGTASSTLDFSFFGSHSVTGFAPTLSFAGGRPSIVFTPATPAAPTKIDSRGFTRGAYRGYGEVYSFAIPAAQLIAGTNTIAISCASGSAGTDSLSPNDSPKPSLGGFAIRTESYI